MKFKMAENSLFAILLRKPWWISIVVAVVLSLALAALLPRRFALYGASTGVPFLIVGIIAAFRQWNAPSPAYISQITDSVSTMSWRDFANTIEQALQRDGSQVARHTGAAAEFETTQNGRIALVSCKRWKAAHTGVEPLRELYEAAQARGAQDCIYITIGQLSDNARQYAHEKNIRVLQGAQLAQLLRGMVRSA